MIDETKTLTAEEVRQLSAIIDEYNDIQKMCNENPKCEMKHSKGIKSGLLRALRIFGYDIEKDEHGYICKAGHLDGVFVNVLAPSK